MRKRSNSLGIHRPSAFTLIELLVVIAIISVLLSILMPALASARESTRRVKCLANLKGIGVGLANYMNTSKDVLPLVRPLHGEEPSGNDPSLLDLLGDYIDAAVPARDAGGVYYASTDPWVCPADRVGKDSATDFEPVWRTDGISYEYFPGILMFAAEMMMIRNTAEAVTQTLMQPKFSMLPVLMDQDDWHPLRKKGPPRNSLYLTDWRSDWSADLSVEGDDLWGDLMGDIFRFGGMIPPP
ncbi:MAG: type II secretion system protein [Phycisphaerales bacterium]|nr:type II secretion system protein [Phycisphaerales bacterium]